MGAKKSAAHWASYLVKQGNVDPKNSKQIKNHGPLYHTSGYSTRIGNLQKYKKSINRLNKNEIIELQIIKNELCTLNFENNITVKGTIHNIYKENSKIAIITFKECIVKHGSKLLFDTTWGYFDLICAS